MGVVYGAGAGVATGALLALIGAPVLVASHLLVRHRARLGSLSWQLGAGVAVPVALALLGVEVIALVLFVSAHDAFTMALLLASAGTLATYSAWLLTSRVTRDIAEVRDAVTAVGRGDRDRRVRLEAGDELGQLGVEVNRMTAELERGEREREAMERERRDLLAAVSHDLRTPLSSMRLLTEAVRDGFAGERALEQLGFHLQSLEHLIDDLFELSRLEAGDVEWRLEPVDVRELVEETVEGMGVQARAAGVALEAGVPAGVPPVRGNPEKLQRVLFNLIDNALRHTPGGGTIAVSATPEGGLVAVAVSDTGTGIEAADRARAFEPFFRGGPSASRPRNGAGLGLPICRAIVQAHGGTIDLAPAATGTTVRFSVPQHAGAPRS
jgi:signal transduction histidine kinase